MFLNICRLCCKSEDALIPVYDQRQDEELSNKILVCFGVDIKEDDRVTKEICRSCYFFTNSYYEYRKTCLQNNQKILEEFEQTQHPIKTLNLPSDRNVIPSTSVDNGYSDKTNTVIGKTIQNIKIYKETQVDNGYSDKTSTIIAKATQNTKIFREAQQLSQDAFLNSLNLSNRNNTDSRSNDHKSITKIINKFPKIILPFDIRTKDLDPFVRIYPIKESVKIDKFETWAAAQQNESSAIIPKTSILLKRLHSVTNAMNSLHYESLETNQSRLRRRVRKSISYDESPKKSTPEKINRNHKRLSIKSVDHDEPKLKQPCFVSLTRIDTDSSVIKLPKIDDTNNTSPPIQENLLMIGEELRTFICQTCNKLFDTEYSFKTHKRMMHKSSLRCTQCPKRFKIVEHLMEHLQMHLTVVNQKMNTFVRKRTGGVNYSKKDQLRTNEFIQGPTSPPCASDDLENSTSEDVSVGSNENAAYFEIINQTTETNDLDTDNNTPSIPPPPPPSDANEMLELKIFQDLEPDALSEMKDNIQLIVDSDDDDDVVFVSTVANEDKPIVEHPVELSAEPKQYFIEHEPVAGGHLLNEENFIKYVFDKCKTNESKRKQLKDKKWCLKDLPRWNRRAYVPLEIAGCKNNKFEVNYGKFTAPNTDSLQLWEHEDVIVVPKKVRASSVQVAKQRFHPTNTYVPSTTEPGAYTIAEINLPENETDIESTLTQNLIIPRETLIAASGPNASSLKPTTSNTNNNNDASKISIVVVPPSKPSGSTTSPSSNQPMTVMLKHMNNKQKSVIRQQGGGPPNPRLKVYAPAKVPASTKPSNLVQVPSPNSLLKTNNSTSSTSQPLVLYQMTSNQPSKRKMSANSPVQLVYQVTNTSVPETTSTTVTNSTHVTFKPNPTNSNYMPPTTTTTVYRPSFSDIYTPTIPKQPTQYTPNTTQPSSILKAVPAPRILNQTLTYQSQPNLPAPYLTYTVPNSIPKIGTTYTIPDSTSKGSTTYAAPMSTTANLPNTYANQFKKSIEFGLSKLHALGRPQYMQQTPDAASVVTNNAPIILNQLLSSPCSVITNNITTTTPTTNAEKVESQIYDLKRPTIRIKSLSELTLPTNPRDQLHENYTETLSKYVTENPNPVNNSTYRSTNDEYLQIS